jgi:hypothetical protein
MASLLTRLVEHPRATRITLAMTALLTAPTLAAGFYSDDHAHLAILEGAGGHARATALDLYRFVGNAPGELHDLVGLGPLPWWSAPTLKLHFFRPLASALLWLCHALFGRVAPLHHLVNVVAYLALVLVVAALHRRVVPGARPVAVLATLLFALDGHNAHAVTWIAGRHLLVSAVPAVLGLIWHLRAVHEGYRPGRWLGPLGLAVGLLGGESALGVLAYWIAHDWLAPGLDRRARLRASLPVLGVVAAYAVFYKARGYGAVGSAEYLDPASDPAGFAVALGARLPALLADAFVRLPAEVFHVAPLAVVLVGLAGTALTAAFYVAVRPAVPEEERAALRWLVPGALGAMAVGAGGFLGSRLLLVPGLGLSVLIAVLLRRGSDRLALVSGGGRRLLRAGLAWLVVAHLVLGPLTLVTNALTLRAFAEANVAAARAAEITGPRGREVVVLAASDPAVSFYIPTIRVAELVGEGARWHVISGAKHTHRITRTGSDTVRVDILGGRMLEQAFETLFRDGRSPLRAGDRVALRGAAVTVLAAEQGGPTSIEVRFDVPLEDPGLVLVAWRDGRLSRLPPLALGEPLDVPWSPGPFRIF